MGKELEKEIKHFILHFVLAGVTAAVSKTIVAPIDRIKLIIQNQDSALQVLTGEREKYKGFIDCLLRIPKEQGLASLWRGNTLNIMRYVPTQALNFSFQDAYFNFIRTKINTNSDLKTTLIVSLAGGMAGGTTTCILFPVEFCLTRISVDMGGSTRKAKHVNREFYNLRDCLSKVTKKAGIRGLYRGMQFSVAGVGIYRGLYFGLFHYAKVLWRNHKPAAYAEIERPPLLTGLILAQLSSMAAGIIAYPLDTLGRRLMLDSGRPEHLRLYKSALNALQLILSKEGPRGLYKGVLVNCIRGFGGAVVLVLYDEVLHRIDWDKWLKT